MNDMRVPTDPFWLLDALHPGYKHHREVILHRFGKTPKTLAATAKIIGVTTPERVRQIQNLALSRIRRAVRQWNELNPE